MISPIALAAQQYALRCSPPPPNVYCPSIAMLAVHCEALTLPLLPQNLLLRKERLPLHHCTDKVLQGTHPSFGGEEKHSSPPLHLQHAARHSSSQKTLHYNQHHHQSLHTHTLTPTPTPRQHLPQFLGWIYQKYKLQWIMKWKFQTPSVLGNVSNLKKNLEIIHVDSTKLKLRTWILTQK